MTDDPEDVEALAADDATELFGWPVSLLDAIRESQPGRSFAAR